MATKKPTARSIPDPQQFSQAGDDDHAGQLTTTYKTILGLQYAQNAQLNIVATFASESDEVIIQLQKGGGTKNLTYTFSDTRSSGSFTPGTYRIVAYVRGFGITASRIGLSSTAVIENANWSAVI